MNNDKKVLILKDLINDGGAAKFARVEANVEQKQLKRGNPLKDATITKDVTYNVKLNCSYSNMVNSRLKKEDKDPNFVAKQNWHQKVYDGVNGSIVEKRSDTSCKYLMMILDKSTTEAYYVDGRLASPNEVEVIKAYTPDYSAAEQGGLEDKVNIITVKIENINLVKCGATVLFG
jgi:hypothetical protein